MLIDKCCEVSSPGGIQEGHRLLTAFHSTFLVGLEVSVNPQFMKNDANAAKTCS